MVKTSYLSNGFYREDDERNYIFLSRHSLKMYCISSNWKMQLVIWLKTTTIIEIILLGDNYRCNYYWQLLSVGVAIYKKFFRSLMQSTISV